MNNFLLLDRLGQIILIPNEKQSETKIYKFYFNKTKYFYFLEQLKANEKSNGSNLDVSGGGLLMDKDSLLAFSDVTKSFAR